jgi:hypothetical protein
LKVLIGSFRTDHGTVETPAPDGEGLLLYSGPDPAHVQAIVESEREWRDRAGIQHTLTDEELLRSLPYRLHGYILWAVAIDEMTGLTQDQPRYDPWGDVWYFGKKAPATFSVPSSLPSVEDRERAAKQQEWNRRAAEWVARVRERARAPRQQT